MNDMSMDSGSAAVDVVVVGAGFAGINALHHMHQAGYRVRLIEAAAGVGGTWYWNTYPGARVDIESVEYSYGFSDVLQQEWHWPERYSSQPEVKRYLEWVVDRLELAPFIQLKSRISSAIFAEDTGRWTLHVEPTDDAGSPTETITSRFCIMATGFLSAAYTPDIPGIDRFENPILHTGAWPRDGVALDGLTLGVIGTGASGVQLVPRAAEVAGHVNVLQRTPNWCMPIRNEPIDETYERYVKDNYQRIRELEHSQRGSGHVIVDHVISTPETRSALEVTDEERTADYEYRWQAGGVHFGKSFPDLKTSKRANDTLREFLTNKIRQAVKDPAVAEHLIPTHPPLSRRPCGEIGYYEAFNRDNVTLIDIRSDPIVDFGPDCVILTSGRTVRLDVLICATGFDAGGGPLRRIDIVGRDGLLLRDKWANGIQTHLGMATTGFPNMFFLDGPQSPAPFFSPPLMCDYQMGLIDDLLSRVRNDDGATIEPSREAEESWSETVDGAIAGTLIAEADSWWMTANVPGRHRQIIAYAGGFENYRSYCEKALEGSEYVIRR